MKRATQLALFGLAEVESSADQDEVLTSYEEYARVLTAYPARATSDQEG